MIQAEHDLLEELPGDGASSAKATISFGPLSLVRAGEQGGFVAGGRALAPRSAARVHPGSPKEDLAQ